MGVIDNRTFDEIVGGAAPPDVAPVAGRATYTDRPDRAPRRAAAFTPR